MPAPEWVVEEWPGSATIIAVCSHGIREGKPTDETLYYVSSLRTGAKAMLRHVRDRWSIENSWHWVRDVLLQEDVHRYREDNGVQILDTLQPGDQRPSTRWNLVDHRGHRRPGSRHQGGAQAPGVAKTHQGRPLLITSNRPWLDDLTETVKAHFRAKVELPFRLIKRQFGFQKTRLRGMPKSRCKVNVLAALSNLFMVRHRLLCKT